MESLAALHFGREGSTPKQVNDRFDILWSRIAVSEKGVVGEGLRSYDTETHALVRLFDAMKREENAVVTLQPDDKDEILRLYDEFEPYRQDLHGFSRAVFFGEQSRISSVRTDLRRSAVFIALATAAAFVIGSVLLLLVERQSARNRQMAETNLELAEASRTASEAKTRFLTMMSHELRTPMNGVLGMLSLTRKSGLTKPQLRLVEQAERSGQQMIAMLGDILDYSALQDQKITFESKPFEPRQLAHAVRELFASVARREGISFTVETEPGCPKCVVGDFKRLRQVIAHFSSYIVQTAGTRTVDIVIGHEGDDLRVHINFEHKLSSGKSSRWLPEILMGERTEKDAQFATDALGPAVSRSILDRMGGRLALDHTGDQISIVLSAPAQVLASDAVYVHIDTRSEALRTICSLALADEAFVIVDDPDVEHVNTVLMEPGGHDELQRVEAARKRFPNALIIAIGAPSNPADFDDTMSLPLDVANLRLSVVEERTA